MKAQVRQVEDHGTHYDMLAFMCPGCELMPGGGSGLHMLPVNTTEHSPSWTWDGNLGAPTVEPSILTTGARVDGVDHRCHSFLRGGVFEFLEDCTHDLAGQSVPMPDLPEWFLDETERKEWPQ
jgi:hypothetical protein